MADVFSLEAKYITETAVVFSWPPVDGAVHYNIIKDGRVIINTQGTLVAVEHLFPLTTYDFAVEAVGIDETIRSETITVVTPDADISKYLVVDRTKKDVDGVKYLNSKAWQDMTENEQGEWMFGSEEQLYFSDNEKIVCTDGNLQCRNGVVKGSYNAEDLNRVGAAVYYVAAILNSVGYAITPTVRTDWQKSDIFYLSDLQNYLDNIEALRNRLMIWQTTPPTPPDFNHYQRANDIEKIILDVYEILQNMISQYQYCGTFYCGE